MTELRKHMIKDMQLAGLSQGTQGPRRRYGSDADLPWSRGQGQPDAAARRM